MESIRHSNDMDPADRYSVRLNSTGLTAQEWATLVALIEAELAADPDSDSPLWDLLDAA
jgi:hypothetical protein